MEGTKDDVEFWGGVGGHGLQRDMSVSFPPSQRKESSLAGEPGCGSSAGGGGGRTPRFRPDKLEVLLFSFRLRNMGAGRRMEKRKKLVDGRGSLAVEGRV